MPVIRSRAGRLVVFSSPPPSPPSSPLSLPRCATFNDGFPADQAAEYEAGPEDDGEDDLADPEPANADLVGEEARSSDGEDDGADLDDFVVAPGVPASQGSSSTGESTAVFSQQSQSSLADGDNALEDDPDGDYVPPGVDPVDVDAGDADLVDNDAIEDGMSEDEGYADLGNDNAFLNFLDDDVDVFADVDFDIQDDGNIGDDEDGADDDPFENDMYGDEDVINLGNDNAFLNFLDDFNAEVDQDNDVAMPIASSSSRRIASPVSDDDDDFFITAVKHKSCFVQGTGGAPFPIFNN
ncbi:hypothetical protein CF319_g2800 [Tilletia indica]|uniref:Uncharacterized protein n=1 Tax=Tilletia indica TaxID=43049 RepID=A0A177TR13_9BASI|nr:hypothetical protein CF319_g2800 [Tilletia indica]KAE8255226.1 hypothetical protein A4X13_0g3119 [Tilletia indica]